MDVFLGRSLPRLLVPREGGPPKRRWGGPWVSPAGPDWLHGIGSGCLDRAVVHLSAMARGDGVDANAQDGFANVALFRFVEALSQAALAWRSLSPRHRVRTLVVYLPGHRFPPAPTPETLSRIPEWYHIDDLLGHGA